MSPEILAFVSYYSANFQPILDCFIPNLKLMYEHSENIKADRLETVVFTHIKSNVELFLGTPGIYLCYYMAVDTDRFPAI